MSNNTGISRARRWFVLAIAGLAVISTGLLTWQISRLEKLTARIHQLEEQNRDLEVRLGVQAESLATLHGQAEIPGDPSERYEVFVLAKQWLWKFQHPSGYREIGELRVPAGVPIQLFLTSEDVVHRLDIPEVKLKVDAVPGKYTTAWTTFPKPGRYAIACGEHCGTNHHLHTATVIAVEPAEFKLWQQGMMPGIAGASNPTDGSPAWNGRKLFLKMQCINCHSGDANARGPSLEGLFGTTVKLKDGTLRLVDEEYLRESIRKPTARVVDGWTPIMPAYGSSQLSEEELVNLIAYLRSPKWKVPNKNEVPRPVGTSRLQFPGRSVNDRLERVKIDDTQPRLEPLRPVKD